MRSSKSGSLGWNGPGLRVIAALWIKDRPSVARSEVIDAFQEHDEISVKKNPEGGDRRALDRRVLEDAELDTPCSFVETTKPGRGPLGRRKYGLDRTTQLINRAKRRRTVFTS